MKVSKINFEVLGQSGFVYTISGNCEKTINKVKAAILRISDTARITTTGHNLTVPIDEYKLHSIHTLTDSLDEIQSKIKSLLS
jgi:hypothetical protein